MSSSWGKSLVAGTAFLGAAISDNTYITLGCAAAVVGVVFKAGMELKGIRDKIEDHDKKLTTLTATRTMDLDTFRSEIMGEIRAVFPKKRDTEHISKPNNYQSEQQTTTLRLLLVDDDRQFRYLFRNQLGTFFEISEAESLRQANELMKSGNFHAVILDLRMPGEKEAGVVKKFLDSNSGALCLVMSGVTDPNVASAALQQGADCFITKDDIQYPNFLSKTIHHAIRRRGLKT